MTERGRVLRTVGGVYWVEVGDETIECSLRGRLKRERGLGRVAVGDGVVIERLPDGGGVISEILARRSRLSRRVAGGRRERIIAANVDQLAAVFAVSRPAPHFQLLDRFLVLAEASDITAFVVVNKTDQAAPQTVNEQFELYAAIGYPVLRTSAAERQGLEALRDRLTGHLTILVGPSGVGKSSLLNELQPGLGLRVGELSQAIQRGRHTTVAASLQRLHDDGYVVDTPGLSKLRFWEVGNHELPWCFREFRPYLGNCKFPDCQHVHEPECAILAALEAGQLARQRYESYKQILAEREGERV